MKIRLALLTTATVATFAVVLLIASAGTVRSVHAAGGGCPADYAAGFYGFNGQSLFTSTTAAPAPIAAAGAIFLTSDGAGLLTGTLSGYETVNNRGTVTRTDFTGTFTMVSGHCYGSATVTPTTGLATHFDLVPVGWSNGGRATQVLFVETDPHKIGTLTAISM